MKLLILGANGQVGWELQRALAPLGEVNAWDRAEVDLGDSGALRARVLALRPDAIVNAAAYTAVDLAEGEAETARMLNAEAPAVLAGLGIPLVHFSTDYVFGGSGDLFQSENSPTNPLSVYGLTKLEGEVAVRQACATTGTPYLIFRTSWVYAARGRNFVKTVLRLAAHQEQLTIVDDQVGAPTGAELLADCSAHALRALLRGDTDRSLSGTYHLCAAGSTSWAEYARFIIATAQELGRDLRCVGGIDGVRGIPTSAYTTAARRPLNSRLDCSRFESTFGLTLPPWQQGVRRLLTELCA